MNIIDMIELEYSQLTKDKNYPCIWFHLKNHMLLITDLVPALAGRHKIYIGIYTKDYTIINYTIYDINEHNFIKEINKLIDECN